MYYVHFNQNKKEFYMKLLHIYYKSVYSENTIMSHPRQTQKLIFYEQIIAKSLNLKSK